MKEVSYTFDRFIVFIIIIIIVPAVAPSNVTVTRSTSNPKVLTVAWEPLTLVEAKGFINYTVTLTPGGSRKRQTGTLTRTLTRTVPGDQNSTTFTDTNPATDYTVIMGTLTSDELNSGPGKGCAL